MRSELTRRVPDVLSASSQPTTYKLERRDGGEMRQLNINNLRLSVDARDNDARNEAHRVLAMVNDLIEKCDGSPALLITEDGLDAEYEEVGDGQ